MFHVKRALIMAAGIGERMHPLTLETPKPLLRVNGVRMIDSVVDALHRNGIFEIYVVVGYKKEQFEAWVQTQPGVVLIENPLYRSCNNIASLYAAREHLSDCMILDGDQLVRNPEALTPLFARSGYNAVWTEQETKEWLLTAEDGARLRRDLELEFEDRQNRIIYWDDVALFCHPEKYRLGIFPMREGDVVEIDTPEELAAVEAWDAEGGAG